MAILFYFHFHKQPYEKSECDNRQLFLSSECSKRRKAIHDILDDPEVQSKLPAITLTHELSHLVCKGSFHIHFFNWL